MTALSNGNTYTYDANGNMTQRYVNGQTYNLTYDAENHMTGLSGAASAAFTYNGDGQRVISTLGNDTTIFVGNYFEWHVATEESTQYYHAGSTRIGMRTEEGGLQFILGDHLGSSSVMADASGALLSSQGYMPWGETRFGAVGTEYQFTGQYRQSAIGLDYYNTRWYDPALGRWNQPDNFVPLASQGTQAFDRYTYVNNNPIIYDDPSGQDVGCAGRDASQCSHPSNSMSQPTSSTSPRQKLVLMPKLDLNTYQSKNQFDSDVMGTYGGMACGIVAGASAGATIDEVGNAAKRHNYSPSWGMQPTDAAETYKEVYGKENVNVHDIWNVVGISDAIEAGEVVIVDILVSNDTGTYKPSPSGNKTVSHFAQVIGVNWTTSEVYISDTLGGTYWTLTFEQFYDVWMDPENNATPPEEKYPPDHQPEGTQYWGVDIVPD